MKKIFLLVVIVGASVAGAEAQRIKSNYPNWTISKEIVKSQQHNVLYTPAVITTARAPIAAKGISALQIERKSSSQKRVEVGNKPSFVISKAVARRQYEQKSK